MPRRKRQLSKTGFYHWINRGINHKKIFHREKDFKKFLSLIADHKDELGIKLYHYCLMSNHVHLLLYAEDTQKLAKFSHFIQRRYTYYYCKNYKWRGQLFRRVYRSLGVDKDTYLLECGRYIERNPLRAKMVQKVEDYLFSSYSFYLGNEKTRLLTRSPAYLALSEQPNKRKKLYAEYVSQDRAYDQIVDELLLKS